MFVFAHEIPTSGETLLAFLALIFFLIVLAQGIMLRGQRKVPGTITIEIKAQDLDETLQTLVQEAFEKQAEVLLNKARSLAEQRDKPITRLMLAEAWSKIRFIVLPGLEW